jgi:copper(I)-binding protein
VSATRTITSPRLASPGPLSRGLHLATAAATVAILSACDRRRPSAGPFTIRDAWARAADSGSTGGAYLTLVNADTAAVTITGLSSPAAQTTELHESMQHDGMSHMVPRPTMVIPRDSALTMAPGGLHVMLNDLRRALHVGDSVPVVLSVNNGRTVTVMVPVRAP